MGRRQGCALAEAAVRLQGGEGAKSGRRTAGAASGLLWLVIAPLAQMKGSLQGFGAVHARAGSAGGAAHSRGARAGLATWGQGSMGGPGLARLARSGEKILRLRAWGHELGPSRPTTEGGAKFGDLKWGSAAWGFVAGPWGLAGRLPSLGGSTRRGARGRRGSASGKTAGRRVQNCAPPRARPSKKALRPPVALLPGAKRRPAPGWLGRRWGPVLPLSVGWGVEKRAGRLSRAAARCRRGAAAHPGA
jgi:hypothetical protein